MKSKQDLLRDRRAYLEASNAVSPEDVLSLDGSLQIYMLKSYPRDLA